MFKLFSKTKQEDIETLYYQLCQKCASNDIALELDLVLTCCQRDVGCFNFQFGRDMPLTVFTFTFSLEEMLAALTFSLKEICHPKIYSIAFDFLTRLVTCCHRNVPSAVLSFTFIL